MLIRFVVSNFMSFKEETEFNMLKSKGNGSRQLPNHIIKTNSGVEVLKTAAIYGANAAGKSNLINAISYLKDIVFGEETLLIPQSKRFRLDESYKNKSSIFRIEYEFEKLHFDYAVEIYKGKIKEEWLYLVKSVSKEKEELLFKREGKEVIFGDYFKKSGDLNYVEKFLKKELKDTQTVLNTCYKVFDENDILDKALLSFEKIKIFNPDTIDSDYTSDILMNQKSKLFTKELLLNSKTGIEDIVSEKTKAELFFGYDDNDLKNELIDFLENNDTEDIDPDKTPVVHFVRKGSYNAFIKENNEYYVVVLKTKHFNSDSLFNFDEESDGTNRLFELSPAFEQLMSDTEIVYIIDELERSMHPLLARELLKMYSYNSTSKSQLIFTTHESHLLDDDLLRRDEIWFTEKKADGSTEFYPLSNFNPRGDKVLERGYLQGRYGGIPFLGDFSKLIKEETLK
ncbi:ATP/GTP-binding protein [Flavobacterium sp.]|uniref:AAA family ATPase n=1 Tax=Flavobacterium sp. TaxID=239 RepID=UPI003750ACE7